MIDRDLLLRMYDLMCLQRLFEEKCYFLFLQGLMPSSIHQSHGQEASQVGSCINLRKDDWLFAGHRSVGHYLTKGIPAKLLMAELMMKKLGCAGGMGGALHFSSSEYYCPPGAGILGSSYTHATGAALACQIKRTDQVVMAIIGDGGINEGAVYEAMNFAMYKSLPIVFVCENNFYGASTHVKLVNAVENIAEKAKAYNMEAYTIDGNDIIAVYEQSSYAIEKARSGSGPTFLEIQTYRIAGHSRGDTNSYRDKSEEKAWLSRDPITLVETYLQKKFQISANHFEDTKDRLRLVVDDAVDFAMTCPEPLLEDAIGFVFSE